MHSMLSRYQLSKSLACRTQRLYKTLLTFLTVPSFVVGWTALSFLVISEAVKAALDDLANDTAVQLALSKTNQVFENARLQVVQLTASEIALFLQASAAGFSLQDRPITQHHAENWSQQQQQLPAVRA